jgi:membrane protein implicated in regulation of membrane protease activity
VFRKVFRVLLVVAFVLLIVLPTPWNVIGFVAGLVLFAPEVGYWNRRVRHKPVESGAETLIGREAIVESPLRPTGQVRIDGEIWEARCDGGADPGQTVTVVGRDRLTLLVARATEAESPRQPDN